MAIARGIKDSISMAAIFIDRGAAQDRIYLLEIFFVYALLMSTGAFDYQLTGIDPDMVKPLEPLSTMGRLSSVFVYATTLIIYIGYRRKVHSIIRSSCLLYVFPLLALLSCFWAPDLGTTLRRVIALSFNFLTVAVMVAALPPIRIVRVSVLALGSGILLSVLWVVMLPRYGIHQATDWLEPKHAGLWRGIYTHKNSLGAIAPLALVLMIFFGRITIKSVLFRALVIISATACLAGASSGTGTILTFVMAIVIFLVRSLMRMEISTRAFFGGVILLGIVSVLVAAVPLTYLILQILGKSTDFTGRVPMWVSLIAWGEERALLGFGYSTGFELVMSPRILDLMGLNIGSAHNGYLETFISFGYVGVVLLCIVNISFLMKLLAGLMLTKKDGSITLPFIAGLFFVALFGNITESQFLTQNSYSNMSWALAYVMISVWVKSSPIAQSMTADPRLRSPYGVGPA
ncbi:O-antigen ligase family protein [Microvirga sp. BT689]|uniref:O-antigen ligase family protein n=1 Tax=Microvirga arvi TaxID=2778731 RepID=UPI0019519AA3|nr:O-antigen ligase family protein [Microvirga arvi]MBM6584450.1 O-antigen ligase family protein [Microvirga arvi]